MAVDMEKRRKLDLRPGNTARVWVKVEEKGKTRLQAFEGLIIAHKHGLEQGATITVRKISLGVGVERIFPIFSPNIDKIEIVKKAKARRAKLYYIRNKSAKQVRRKMKQIRELFGKKKKEKEDAEKLEEEKNAEDPEQEKIETVNTESENIAEETKETSSSEATENKLEETEK
jgi:large subunit ribosomal protein L19